jgi:hypothetical protein
MDGMSFYIRKQIGDHLASKTNLFHAVFVNVVVVQTVLLCRLILRCFLFVRVEHHRPNRLPVARVA